jgi:hypothetical protein
LLSNTDEAGSRRTPGDDDVAGTRAALIRALVAQNALGEVITIEELNALEEPGARREFAKRLQRRLDGTSLLRRYGWTSRRNVRPPSDAAEGLTMPVTIYLSEETDHEHVQIAVEQLVARAGLEIVDRDDPVLGSWFRAMRAAVGNAVRSPAARQGALTAVHVADTHLVLARDAAITATLMQNLAPVIASLQNTKDAVIRVGALLVVKVDWTLNVVQLTAAQQAILDHRPRLAAAPREIVEMLNLQTVPEDDAPPALT